MEIMSNVYAEYILEDHFRKNVAFLMFILLIHVVL